MKVTRVSVVGLLNWTVILQESLPPCGVPHSRLPGRHGVCGACGPLRAWCLCTQCGDSRRSSVVRAEGGRRGEKGRGVYRERGRRKKKWTNFKSWSDHFSVGWLTWLLRTNFRFNVLIVECWQKLQKTLCPLLLLTSSVDSSLPHAGWCVTHELATSRVSLCWNTWKQCVHRWLQRAPSCWAAERRTTRCYRHSEVCVGACRCTWVPECVCMFRSVRTVHLSLSLSPPTDLRSAGVDCVTLGQYMQPTKLHLKVWPTSGHPPLVYLHPSFYSPFCVLTWDSYLDWD